MLAYHDDPAIKALYLARVTAHEASDEIEHGYYWERGKGCAVGCTIHGSEHRRYETELGIPRSIALLEDRLFEGMGNGAAKAFPRHFLAAIRPGADLSLVIPRFLVWLLTDETDGVIRFARPDGAAAIRAVAALHRRVIDGGTVTSAEWDKACSDAAAAADAADAAAAVAAAAAAADADAAYAAAARLSAYKQMGDKLVELLGAA